MKRYLRFFLFFIITLVFAELLSAQFYTWITPERGRTVVEMLTAEDRYRSQSVQPHPYMLYVNTSLWKKDGFTQINSLGYRGYEIKPSPDADTTRILTLGESTTYAYPYVINPSDSWPLQLEKLLQKQYNTKIEVINGGLNYATSAELLAHYMFRDRYLGAKFVIIHTGYNDIIPLLFPDYSPEYTHYRKGWDTGAIKLRPGEKALLKFYIFKVCYAWWLRMYSLQETLGQPRDWYDIAPNEALTNLNQNQPDGYKRNLDLLVRTIIEDGALPILFPIPFAQKEIIDKDPQMASFISRHFDVLEKGLQKNYIVISDVSHKYKIPLITVNANEIPLEDFIDHIHLREHGESVKAYTVAKTVLPILFKAND